MQVILKDPQAEGNIEVWTRSLEENVQVAHIYHGNLEDLYSDCTEDGASEPDYRLLAEGIQELFIEWGLRSHDGKMFRAILRFIEPGPLYTDDDISWEA